MHPILCTGVCKSFQKGGRRVLDGLDLQVRAGEIAALVGRSGCGKTTLLRMISGLDTPDAGSISFGETGPAPKIGVVFQEHRLFPWMSVRENIALAVRNRPADEAGRSVDEILEMVGLADVADAYPESLSGGMSQRAGFARALVAKPDVLLLDEAFSALDALTRHRLYGEFTRLWQWHRMTVLLVTHDVSEASLLASSVYRMEEGRIVGRYAVDAAYPRSLSDESVSRTAQEILNDFFSKEQTK